MQLIVISSPERIGNEAVLINALFDAGMRRLHLRKPNASAAALVTLLNGIDPAYRSEVVLHQHHELAEHFGLWRKHYPEKLRLQRGRHESPPSRPGLSTSIHDLSTLAELGAYEYVFFGPVFNSFSKPGYHSNLPHNFRLPARPAAPAIIAIGGIDADHVHLARAMNFDGVAVLGAIWNKPQAACIQFKKMLSRINNDFQNDR